MNHCQSVSRKRRRLQRESNSWNDAALASTSHTQPASSNNDDQCPVELGDRELLEWQRWQAAECTADNNMNRALESYASRITADDGDNKPKRRQDILIALGWNSSTKASRLVPVSLDLSEFGLPCMWGGSSYTSNDVSGDEIAAISSSVVDQERQTEPTTSDHMPLVHEGIQGDDQTEFIEAAVSVAIQEKGLAPIAKD